MNKIKVVTIGGGSSYTPELVDGFIKRYDTLPVSELWLVDVPEGLEKVETVAELARRMIKKANLPMKIYTTFNRREALVDADFVTTQFRVGFLEARMKDEEIPLSHGVIGQETNGAGGMFKALRTVPVILDVVKDIQELCPSAWLINFTNPAGMITEAVLRYTDFKKVIGLCNVPIHMQFDIAKVIGVDSSSVKLELQGLNHHNFITKIYLDDQDITLAMIKKYLDDETHETMKNIVDIPFSKEFIKGIGAIPNDYLNYYVNTQKQLEKQLEQFAKGETRARVVKLVEKELFELYRNENLDTKPKELEGRGGAHYSDAACNLINSLYNDLHDLQYVNTQNHGAVSNMDYDDVLECACIITANGPIPQSIGQIKRSILGTIQTIKSFELSCVEAAVTGNRELAISALALNPLIPSDELAIILFDELYEAHKPYLTHFNNTDWRK